LTEQARPRWIGIYTALNVLQPRTSSFHTLALNALRQYFADHGFCAEIYIGQSVAAGELEQQPSNLRFVEDVAAGRFAGVVIQSAPETAGWAQWAEGLRVPAVGRHTPYDVQAGYDEMVRRSVRHLVGQGCRRIAMLSFAPGAGEVALQSALTECGLDYRAEWVRHDLHPMLSGAGWEEFREIWMARREKPDGLLVTDDVLFDEARIAIQELGLHVPEQLRIVTHANKGAARRYPFAVTEVQIDPERYAESLGGMLLSRLRGEAVEPPTVTLPFEMVEARPVATTVEAACYSAKSAKAAAFATKHEPSPLSQVPERDEGVASTNSVASVAARIVPHEVTVGNG
jgi:DNA-binding LacI/PurR family transcriptional regulator